MNHQMGLIGVGAFGEFMLRHLLPYFDISVYDRNRNLGPCAARYRVHISSLEEAASRDIVLLSVPVQHLASAVEAAKPSLRPGALVIDVCSVKLQSVRILADTLPNFVDVVSTHPLFGPQSGRDGIRNMRVALTNVRGRRLPEVAHFLRRELSLRVLVTTPDRHDREMAYVQGLTHLIARAVNEMRLPPRLRQSTVTFDHLMKMVGFVGHDSNNLFDAIQRENPFVPQVTAEFLGVLNGLTSSLSRHDSAAAPTPDETAAPYDKEEKPTSTSAHAVSFCPFNRRLAQ